MFGLEIVNVQRFPVIFHCFLMFFDGNPRFPMVSEAEDLRERASVLQALDGFELRS